ncbi:cell adhesion molecule 2-like [Thrips palmi]|uniref:Cell adhesion molecule 2-like n=1 Tax=Thrips palmi TaxID=161013 RepID=A0A6P8YSH0_THRPL|nr:cell adhesion molecule 2-like [Thrips palmi]
MSEEHLYLYVHLLLAGVLSPHGVFPLSVRVRVPPFKQRGEDAVLHCQYDMESPELYSVQWYKDNEEFFRYKPRSDPQKHPFKDIAGVKVDNPRSNSKQVTLKQVSIRTSGVYRCEVSGEAPYFHSAHSEGRMEVVSIPKENPTITGPDRQYQVGDNLGLNCTSAKSHPASKLQWFINDKPVTEPSHLEEHPHAKHAHGLYTTMLGLRFTIRPHHFRDGSMVLRCVATVSTELWRSHTKHEVVNDDDAHEARMLQNREAFFELKGGGGARTAPAALALLLLAAALLRRT